MRDRDLIDAADRHLTPKPRCAFCGERVHEDARRAEEYADHLGVAFDARLCDACYADAVADAADDVLAADPDFVTVCDARRDGWIAALEAETAAQWAAIVRLGADVLDEAATV